MRNFCGVVKIACWRDIKTSRCSCGETSWAENGRPNLAIYLGGDHFGRSILRAGSCPVSPRVGDNLLERAVRATHVIRRAFIRCDSPRWGMCSIRGVKIGHFPRLRCSIFPLLLMHFGLRFFWTRCEILCQGSGTFRREGTAEACFLCQVGGVFLGQESGMQVSFPNNTSRFRVMWKR